MGKEHFIIIGVVLIGFGVIGYAHPVNEFGSVINNNALCVTILGAAARAGSLEIAAQCFGAQLGTLFVWASMGIGVILTIWGYKFPDFQLADLKKKPSFFLCVECNIAFPTEADLYNHDVQKHPHRVEEEEEEFYEEEEEVVVEAPVEEEKKTRVKISFKERLKNSPSLQGVLIGVVLAVMLVGIISLSTNQTFYVMNDGLAPDVNEGDLIKNQKIPLSKIKKNDIIAYVDPTGEFNVKIGKVRSIDTDRFTDEVVGFKTSNNVSPQKLQYVPVENFIGKIIDVSSSNALYEFVLWIQTGPNLLIMIIATFVAPIIILKIRKRLRN